MDERSGIGFVFPRLLRRIQNAAMISTRTKPPARPPAIGPTAIFVCEWSLGVTPKIWASFGSWNPLDGSVVVAYRRNG